MTTSSTTPWTCDCGARLLWRRTSVDCPDHGQRALLPAWPSDKDKDAAT